MYKYLLINRFIMVIFYTNFVDFTVFRNYNYLWFFNCNIIVNTQFFENLNII